MSPRVGVLGGTFDPIHTGHLAAADAAKAKLALDRILVVPTLVPPHRPAQPQASPYHRFAMVALAISDREWFRASDIDLQAGGPSYTSATFERLRGEGLAPSDLFFITGADAFTDVSSWYEYPAILERSHFVVVSRPGHPVSSLRDRLPSLARHMHDLQGPDPRQQGVALPAIFLVDAPTPDVSSTTIRQRCAEGASVAGLVPPAVEDYIERHHLYRSDSAPKTAGPERPVGRERI